MSKITKSGQKVCFLRGRFLRQIFEWLKGANIAAGGGSGWPVGSLFLSLTRLPSVVQHALAVGGRIEPAEPEPPPAHSFGRVGEDVMGRLRSTC